MKKHRKLLSQTQRTKHKSESCVKTKRT